MHSSLMFRRTGQIPSTLVCICKSSVHREGYKTAGSSEHPCECGLIISAWSVIIYQNFYKSFRYPKIAMSVTPIINRYESVPVHPELNPAHPLVVFGDHRFC